MSSFFSRIDPATGQIKLPVERDLKIDNYSPLSTRGISRGSVDTQLNPNYFPGDRAQKRKASFSALPTGSAQGYQGMNPYDFDAIAKERNAWFASENPLPVFDKQKKDEITASSQSIQAPARDMSPLNEMRGYYQDQRNDILSQTDSTVARNNALINELSNYSGGGTGSALALNMLFNNVLPQAAKTAEGRASNIAALPYMNSMGTAGESSRELPRFFQKERIKASFDKSSDPRAIEADIASKQGLAEYHKAQGALYGALLSDDPNKRALAQAGLHGDKTSQKNLAEQQHYKTVDFYTKGLADGTIAFETLPQVWQEYLASRGMKPPVQ
jgi:hypothetical protein